MAKLATFGRDYLVLCRGHPYWDGFGHHSCRADALGRIALAGLVAGSTMHLLFEDCTLVVLTPRLLERWRPWGPLREAEPSQSRLVRILDNAMSNKEIVPGVQCRLDQRVAACVETVLTEGAVGARRARYRLVLVLAESGCPLRFNEVDLTPPGRCDDPLSASTRDATGSSGPKDARVLVVLGGVRDISEAELVAVSEACLKYGIQRHAVSLGSVSELTSKCIKTVEAAAEIGLLASAFAFCASTGWRSQDMPPGSSGTVRRTPLHVIYEVPMTLDAFTRRPEAGTVLVDVFRGSHHNYDATSLSLVCAGDEVLTLRKWDVAQLIMRDRDVDSLFAAKGHRACRGSLQDLLRSECTKLQRTDWGVARSGKLLVLVVDEGAPPLRPVGPDAAAQMCQMESEQWQPLFVIFPRTDRDISFALAACPPQSFALRASLGCPWSAPAFACMLHNEGLLLPTVRHAAEGKPRPHRQLSRPEPVVTCIPGLPLPPATRALPAAAAQGNHGGHPGKPEDIGNGAAARGNRASGSPHGPRCGNAGADRADYAYGGHSFAHASSRREQPGPQECGNRREVAEALDSETVTPTSSSAMAVSEDDDASSDDDPPNGSKSTMTVPGPIHWSNAPGSSHSGSMLAGRWPMPGGIHAVVTDTTVSWPDGTESRVLARSTDGFTVEAGGELCTAIARADGGVMWRGNDAWLRQMPSRIKNAKAPAAKTKSEACVAGGAPRQSTSAGPEPGKKQQPAAPKAVKDDAKPGNASATARGGGAHAPKGGAPSVGSNKSNVNRAGATLSNSFAVLVDDDSGNDANADATTSRRSRHRRRRK